jgi:hypothetical protein
MYCKKAILLMLTAIIFCGGCTSTRYMTDAISIERQHDMRTNRTGGNIGDICINCVNFFVAAILNTQYEVYSRERTFKRISIINQSADSLYVNMVTDIVWKENGYCDIMGIVLPPGAKQKLLIPYPAAYNIYFKSPYSEEEKLEVRTDSKLRRIDLKTGMTLIDH